MILFLLYDVFTHYFKNYCRELQCRKVSLTATHVRHGLKLILQTGVSVCIKTPVQKHVYIVSLLVSHLAFPSSRSPVMHPLVCEGICVSRLTLGAVRPIWLGLFMETKHCSHANEKGRHFWKVQELNSGQCTAATWDCYQQDHMWEEETLPGGQPWKQYFGQSSLVA